MLKKTSIFIVIIIILIFVGLAWYTMVISSPVKIPELKIFTIQKGQSVNEISQNLFKEKLIRSKLAFEAYLYLRKLEGIIKAGDYEFKEDINIRDLVKKLIQGTTQDENQITIIEGWNLEQIGDYLEKEEIVDKEIFIEKANCGCGIRVSSYEFLNDKPKEASLEGFLFPDTYRIYKDATVVDVIHRMLDNFDKKLTSQMRQDIGAQDRNIFEIITLASIVEKEARTPQDKKVVADIFWKRLANGMALESCATINYITGKNDPAAAWADLEVESPYNTYKYPSLPPGPICNPGMDSILAAIYPEESPYWYFLNDSDGNIHFAKNFEEQKQNKWKYLR